MKYLYDMDFREFFFSHRKLKVRVGTSLSNFYDQEMGMGDPQASILSVTLFIVKINATASPAV